MAKTALIIGATGLVGEQCLKELLASSAYDKVIALTRKKLQNNNPKLENIVTDFENLVSIKQQLKANDIFCAMGTTIGKAGSKEAFRKVDFEIPLQVAEIALKDGAQKFVLVSSLGADASSFAFYAKVKGELENVLMNMKFDSVIIFRPSILLGDRKEKRRGEEAGRFIAEKLSFLFAGPLKKYRGTPVDLLAKEMVKIAQQEKKGTRIIENEEIFELAETHS
jgi:uncharacterized protein YbjT (DUF2867 family)